MKKTTKLLALITLLVMMSVGISTAAAAGDRNPVVQPGEVLQTVKTLSWTAYLKVNVRTSDGRYPKGTKVKVTSVSSGDCTVVIHHKKYKIARQYLYITRGLVTSRSKGDYNTYTKNHFVNTKKLKSRTKYLIWVSLAKQRINIYKGSARKWRLIKAIKCSSGVAASTPTGKFRIREKLPVYKGCVNYMNFSGDGFHAWPSNYPNQDGTLGYSAASHGCIRVSYVDSVWMYQNIPLGTRVYIW